jgi:phage shock protein E
MEECMDRWWILALALGVGTACDAETTDRQASAQSAPAAEAAEGAEVVAAAPASESGVVYVDVRTRGEFAAGHVEGAINIPHTELGQRWRELEEHRDDPIVLYCRTGRRSGIAYDILEERGFTSLENGGGLTDMQRQGLPVTR